MDGNAAKILIDFLARYQRNLLAKEPVPNHFRIETAEHKRFGMSAPAFKRALEKLENSPFVELVEKTARRGKWYTLPFIKGWKAGTARYVRFPYAVYDSQKYRNLPGGAVKLLIQRMGMVSDPESLGSIWNGYLDFPYSHFEKWGWKSRKAFEKAKQDLIDCGYLVQTIPESRYSVEKAVVWESRCRYGLKTVKGQISPARFAITWDGYEPSRIKGFVKPTDTPSDFIDLEIDSLPFLDGLYRKANDLMPRSEFPFRAWMDEY